jgi:hypothetical protein
LYAQRRMPQPKSKWIYHADVDGGNWGDAWKEDEDEGVSTASKVFAKFLGLAVLATISWGSVEYLVLKLVGFDLNNLSSLSGPVYLYININIKMHITIEIDTAIFHSFPRVSLAITSAIIMEYKHTIRKSDPILNKRLSSPCIEATIPELLT